MSRAFREGEQADDAAAPAIEYRHGRIEEHPRDPAVPARRIDGDRAEQAEAAPVVGHRDADDLAVVLGDEAAVGIRPEPRLQRLGVAPEGQGIGHPELRAEGEAEDAVRRVDIARREWPNGNRHRARIIAW